MGSKTVGANIFGGNKDMALVILGGIKFETLSDLPCHVFTRVPPLRSGVMILAHFQ